MADLNVRDNVVQNDGTIKPLGTLGGIELRVNPEDNTKAQYKTPSGEWQDFSSGGSGATLLYENSTEVIFPNFTATFDFMRDKFNYLLLGIKFYGESQGITYISIPNVVGESPMVCAELDRLRYLSDFNFTITNDSIINNYGGSYSDSIIVKEIRGINI